MFNTLLSDVTGRDTGGMISEVHLLFFWKFCKSVLLSKVQEIVCSTFYRRHREDTAVQDNGGEEGGCAFLPIAVCLPLLLHCLNSPTHQAIYITYNLIFNSNSM